jgi:hypothetical protein
MYINLIELIQYNIKRRKKIRVYVFHSNLSIKLDNSTHFGTEWMIEKAG